MNWDLSSYFPEFNGAEMLRFKEALRSDVSALRDKAARLPVLTDASAAAWEEILISGEDLSRRMSHLGSYIGCLASADARNEDYLQEEAALTRLRAEFSKLRIEYLRAFKSAADDEFAAFLARPFLVSAENYLKRLREEALRSMAPEKEILATDLGIDGIQSWGTLYNRMSAKLEFDMVFPDGRHQRVPMAQRRSFMDDPDRRVRQAAFQAGNEAWRGIEDVAAAALNAIAGTRLTLNRHRGVNHFLDIALFQSAVSRKTLDSMFEALFANIELPRRILQLKAKTMGRPGVAWFDLGAPLPLPNGEKLSWERARAWVKESFHRAYPRLGQFFEQQVLGKNWVDWEPRTSKRPGAFCSTSMLSKESRIFMTYNESLGDVLTLAHESGHAFHGYLMRDVRPYARGYPMTLAETASTFGEQVLMNGLLEDTTISDTQRATILDIDVGHGAVYLLDIPVRYEFEKAFYAERLEGELSVSRLKNLMVETQRRVLGESLEEGGEDSYFWASKLHFYITGVTFYNFPYTFGYLLSRGLYAMFKKEGAAFLPSYEELLRRAGSDTAENVVKQTVGKDLQSSDFWVDAIRSLEGPLKQLEGLLPRVMPGA
ncbi:MAG TPA: M3 family oligoendopeptidase [Candidatus Binatia bacterium]|nr:M3 family oligoendopeptidase [Candidatus Binatia bacterium]